MYVCGLFVYCRHIIWKFDRFNVMHTQVIQWTAGGKSKLTQNGYRWSKSSISEESFTVYLGIWIIWVWVTGRAFHSWPFSNSTIPSNNTVQYTTVILERRQEQISQINRKRHLPI